MHGWENAALSGVRAASCFVAFLFESQVVGFLVWLMPEPRIRSLGCPRMASQGTISTQAETCQIYSSSEWFLSLVDRSCWFELSKLCYIYFCAHAGSATLDVVMDVPASFVGRFRQPAPCTLPVECSFCDAPVIGVHGSDLAAA